MVSIKVLIFACTLLVAQTQAYPQSTVNGPILDFINEFVLGGEKNIDEVLVELNKLLNTAIADSDKFQQELVSFASNGLDKVLDLVNSRLDVIKARGDGNTVKVITCIQNNRNQIKNNILGLIDISSICDLSVAKEALQTISDLLPGNQGLKSDIYAVVNEIQQCYESNWADEIKCGADIIKSIDIIFSNNSENIIKILLGLILAIENLADQVYPKCHDPNSEIFQEQQFATINSVAACMTS